MFEFMQKFRMTILVLIALGMVIAYGAAGSFTDLFKRGGDNPPTFAFRFPGETADRVVTAGDEFDFRQGMMRMGFRDPKALANQVDLDASSESKALVAFQLMKALGEKIGVHVSDKQVTPVREDGRPVRQSDGEVEFMKGWIRAFSARDLYRTDPGGPTFEEIYETYKTMHEEVRGNFVLIPGKPATDFKIDTKIPEEAKKLSDWFETRKYLANQKMVPEKLDVEIVAIKTHGRAMKDIVAEFDTTYGDITKDLNVSDEEVQARWKSHQAAYRAFLDREIEDLNKAQEDENKKAAAESREPKNLKGGDQPTEFDRCKEFLRREIKMGKLLAQVIDEVKGGKVLKDLTTDRKLPLETLSKVSVDDLQAHAIAGGPRLKGMVMKAIQDLNQNKFKEGSMVEYDTTSDAYLPKVLDEPGSFVATLRMVARYPSRVPEMSEILDFVIEQWQKDQADTERRDRAKAFADLMTKKVDEQAEVKAEIEKFQKERDDKVSAEIAAASLSREKPEDKPKIEAIERIADSARESKLVDVRAKHQAAAFRATSEELGLTIHPVDWIRKSAGSAMVYDKGISEEERLSRFTRSSIVTNGLGILTPGRVGSPTEDTAGGLSAILHLEEKRSPAPSDLLVRPDRAQAAARGLNQNPPRGGFSYRNLCSPEYFNLWAWDVEKEIQHERESSLKTAETRAEVNRRRMNENFRRRRAEIEALRKKEAETPAPQPQAPGTPTPPPAGG